MRRPKLARDTAWLAASDGLAIIFTHSVVTCSRIEVIQEAVVEDVSVKESLPALTN